MHPIHFILIIFLLFDYTISYHIYFIIIYYIFSVENSENYYSMFGLKYTATVTEIREAFEYVAFLLNPDKNAAPGSREAFKGKSEITIPYSK